MPSDRIVVIGGSAGSLTAVKQLVSRLGRGFPAPVLIAIHMASSYKSLLPQILTRAGDLAAAESGQSEALQPGRIYTAAPDKHLMVERGRVFLSNGPKENGHRPSVDVLFRSAAYAYGEGTIGVVLSGALDDGASGLYAIRSVGGIAIVQNPDEAAYRDMPINALGRTEVDYRLGAHDIGSLLNQLVLQPLRLAPPDADKFRQWLKLEVDISASDSAFDLRMSIMDQAKPTRFTCPSCHGVLFEIPEGHAARFRCHTGHGFNLASLLEEHRAHLENKLWQGVMSLQESIGLFNDAADRLEATGDIPAAGELRAKAREAKERADEIRALALSSRDMSKREEAQP